MATSNKFKRWYDKDPTVSLAISILRNATPANQRLAANFIKEKCLKFNIRAPKQQPKKIGIIFRRWYDSQDVVQNSLHHLQIASPDIQKQIAIDLVSYLCKLEENSFVNDFTQTK